MVDTAVTATALVPPPSNQEPLDRLSAAQALLGAASSEATTQHPVEEQTLPVVTRPRSGSIGLDELAAAAANMSSSSDEESDSLAMPPPPPRRRPRSCSNPEGMEKYESRKLILPNSILEEELAQASALAKAHAAEQRIKKRGFDDTFGTSPDSVVTSPIMLTTSLEDEDLEPQELLKRARSRLLEDLSEGSVKGEKGEMTLPHSLSKYKEVCRLPVSGAAVVWK